MNQEPESQRCLRLDKERTKEINSSCRRCGSDDTSVEYAEHYLICENCKKLIMKAWKHNFTHYKQVPWTIREWLNEEKKRTQTKT